jgi:3-dehydroquinate dehydratase
LGLPHNFPARSCNQHIEPTAIIDAIKAYGGTVVEVHISNIHARDELHRHSKVSAAATAVICGPGLLAISLRWVARIAPK